MNNTTVSNKTYDLRVFIKQPMQMVEWKVNMMIDINLHLINALDKSVNHPLLSRCSHIPNS